LNYLDDIKLEFDLCNALEIPKEAGKRSSWVCESKYMSTGSFPGESSLQVGCDMLARNQKDFPDSEWELRYIGYWFNGNFEKMVQQWFIDHKFRYQITYNLDKTVSVRAEFIDGTRGPYYHFHTAGSMKDVNRLIAELIVQCYNWKAERLQA